MAALATPRHLTPARDGSATAVFRPQKAHFDEVRRTWEAIFESWHPIHCEDCEVCYYVGHRIEILNPPLGGFFVVVDFRFVFVFSALSDPTFRSSLTSVQFALDPASLGRLDCARRRAVGLAIARGIGPSHSLSRGGAQRFRATARRRFAD